MLNERWAALYYPYADFRDASFILRAALYYDEVYYLQPGIFAPPQPLDEEAIESWPQIDDSLRLLHEEEVIRETSGDLLGVSHHFIPGHGSQVRDRENRETLIENIIADLEDEHLRRLTDKHPRVAWSFPNLQFIGIAASGIFFDVAERRKRAVEVEYLTSRNLLPKEFSRKITVRDPSELESRLLAKGRNDEALLVPFHVGQSLMINIALLAAQRLEATPMTDSSIHHLFMSRKMQRLQEDPETLEWLRDHDFFRRGRSEGLAHKVIELALPDIQPLSAEKVLSIRENCFDQLVAFRTEMARLATEIEVAPWERDFNHRIEDLVDSKVRPALLDVHHRLRDLEKNLGIRVIEKVAGATPLTVATTLFAGVPLDIALAAGIGVGALAELINYRNQKGSTKRNGLGYLFDLSRSR